MSRVYSILHATILFASFAGLHETAEAQQFNHWQDRFRYLPRLPDTTQPLPELPAVPDVATGDTKVIVAELKALVFIDDATRLAERSAETRGVHIESDGFQLELLRTDEFRQIAESYLGGPVSILRLNELARDIVLLYRNNDQPVVDVSVPEQDVTDGVLQILVTEARIGQVRVEGARWFNPQILVDQVNTWPGDVIYESSLLDDVRWLQRNPFRRVDLLLTPGAEPGETDVIFNIDDRRPVRAYAGYEDTGNRALGLERVFAGFNWYNALWRDDWFGYQFTGSSDLSTLEAHSGYYSHAFANRDVISLYGTYAEYDSSVAVPANNQGVTWQMLLRWNRQLCPWNGWEQGITAGFDFKNTNTALDFGGVRVFATDADIIQFMLGYQGRQLDDERSTSVGAEIFYSPGGWGDKNTSVPYQIIRPDATPWYFYARGYAERRQWLTCELEGVVRVNGQWSDGNLLPIEQLGFGGFNSVRGYDQYAVVGDSGYFVNLELWTPARTVLGDDAVRFLAFCDFGEASNHTLLLGEDPSVDLSSVGCGLRYDFQPTVSLRVDYGWQTAQIANVPDPRERVHIGVVVSR